MGSAHARYGRTEAAVRGDQGQLANVSDMRERLAVALEGVERVRDIVGDLETFSNIHSENLVPVDLRSLIESALRLGRAECRLRARVVTDYRDVPPVLGSPARLAQVFFNLVVNAAQAIPEGDRAGNEIRIVLFAKGADVVVEVHDSGRGIVPAHLGHVFEPFFTTRPVGLGSGLGLSVCHNVISAHRGSIDVTSTPGKGSCFSVRLPADVGRSIENPRGKPLPLAQGRVLDVLVVDDEPEVGRVVARMLAGVHQVTVLRSSVEAEQVLATRPFDVVVCDVMMPDVSGAELFKRLTIARPELARRMVFMTGGTFTERARRFVEEVDNECLTKPFTMAELRRAVEVAAARSEFPN